VSLQGLTDQVFDELYRARDLFGPAPQAAEFSSTTAVASAQQALAAQHAAASGDWHGAGGDAYADVAGAAMQRLGRVVALDPGAAAAMNMAAVSSATGRRLMDGIIAETHAGVAAITPTTDTPAGRRQLTGYLQNQLRRGRAVVQGAEQQSAMAAAAINSAADGYRSTATPDPGVAPGPDDVIVGDGSDGNQMLTVRGVTFKEDGGPGPAPPPPTPGTATQIGPFPVPPEVAAAAPPGPRVPPDPTGGLLMPPPAPAPPAPDDPMAALLAKLTQQGASASLTSGEIRALVDAEVQGKLNDAQRFNLWQMLKKAAGGCVVGGAAAGVVGVITGPLEPLDIAGGCAAGALTGAGGYAMDHDK